MNKNLLRFILAVTVAVVVGRLVFHVVSMGLAGSEFSDKYIRTIGFTSFFSLFLAGFLAAFIAMQREILVSFIAFFILNLFWTYHEIQNLKEIEFNFVLILIYIVLPAFLSMAISLLGGFLAKKLNQLQKKKTGDS